VFFSCEPGEEFIPLVLEHIGEHAMLFASAYLHFDSLFMGETWREGKPYPGTVADLLAREDVPPSAKRKIVLDNSLNHIPADLVVRRYRAAPIASRRQDLEVEHPV